MEIKEGDNDWMKDVPKLASMNRTVPFTVPEGYFDQLNREIKSRIKLEAYCSDSEQATGLPEAYFEELPAMIKSRISLERLKGSDDQGGFHIPHGYFETLIEKQTQTIQEHPQGRIRNLIPSWLGYAAAACLTFVLGALLYMNTDQYQLKQDLAEVPKQEIINYLKVYSTAGDTPFIIEQLNPEQLQSLNADISNEDVEQYLENIVL